MWRCFCCVSSLFFFCVFFSSSFVWLSVVQFQKTYFLSARWEIKTLLIIILSPSEPNQTKPNGWHVIFRATKNQFACKLFDLFFSSWQFSVLFSVYFAEFFRSSSRIQRMKPLDIDFPGIFTSNQSLQLCCCLFFSFASLYRHKFRLFTVCCIQLKIFSIWWNSTYLAKKCSAQLTLSLSFSLRRAVKHFAKQFRNKI